MEYRNLGKSGLKVSVIGLGCNNFGMRIDSDAARAVVHRALDEGISLFDTADAYGNRGGSEQMLGKALGNRRHEVVVASKVGMAMGDGPYMKGASRRHIMNAVEASLKRLGTDYLDLYQIHFPDPETPQEETVEVLDCLVRDGKVRYVGCSNFTGWMLADAVWIARAKGLAAYVSAQNEYNLLNRLIERELVPACRHFGVGILPFFPLASGFLTGKYRRGSEPAKDTRFANMAGLAQRNLTEKNFVILDRLQEFVRTRGHTLVELAMGWLVTQDFIPSVIAGATRPEQVSENVKAGAWRLSAEEMAEVDKLTQ